jgi:Protein of unknown function (DUF2530)
MPAPRRPAPEPVESDVVTVVTVGTALWAVGLVVTLVLHDRLSEHGNSDWVWIMAAGLFLGLVGIRHVRRRRTALRARQSEPSQADGAPNPS